jgi:hypothetical protein
VSRRNVTLPRDQLRALIDACDAKHSPAASRAYELLLDIDFASAEIAIVVPAVETEPEGAA